MMEMNGPSPSEVHGLITHKMDDKMEHSERSSGFGFHKTSNNMPNAFITPEIKGCTCNVMYNFCWNRRQSYIPPTSGVIELIYAVYEGNTKSVREIISIVK